jgi:hypothetical protein
VSEDVGATDDEEEASVAEEAEDEYVWEDDDGNVGEGGGAPGTSSRCRTRDSRIGSLDGS